MFKVNNKDNRTTPGVVLVSLLLTSTYFTPCSSVSIVNFELVNVGWAFPFSFDLLLMISREQDFKATVMQII